MQCKPITSCSLVKICCLFIFQSLYLPVYSQIKITGKIIDGVTREPLGGATVYVDQTKLMTQSDARGIFSLGGVAPGATVIISYTGYAKLSSIAGNTKDTVVYELFASGGALDNVVLKAKTKDTWQKWGKLFLNILIGKDMDKECVLMNPDDVWFQFDKKQMLLRAWARKPLQVENKMLGYVMHIDFDSLAYSLVKGNITYTMTEYFEFINEGDEGRQRTIAANRLRAYRGSRMHFARSLYRANLREEGFNLYQYKGSFNSEKSRVEMLLLKTQAERGLSEVMETGNKVDMATFGKDSALYFNKVLNQPGYFFQDSLPVAIGQRWKKASGNNANFRLGTDSILLVYRDPENSSLPEKVLRKWMRMKEPGFALTSYDFIQAGAVPEKYSLMYLLSGENITIRENGFIENNLNLFYEGFLADNRLAYDLPWDYDPIPDEQNLLTEQFTLLSGTGRQLENSLQRSAVTHTASELYLHLDKTIYDPGENIWFAAYLLRSGFKKEEHHTLYVLLQDAETKRNIAAEQFIMQDGHGAGYFFLADSLPPGTYHLLAYTNTYPLEKNQVIFDQAITLRPATREYTLQYAEPENIYRNDSVFIHYRIKSETGYKVAGTEINFELTADGKKYQSGRLKLKENGYAELKGIPLKNIAGKKLVLNAELRNLSIPLHLRQELQVKTNYIRIRWYPEGGELVHNLPARMAYEITDLNHQPVKIKLQLRAGDYLIADMNTDGSGTGIIDLIPGDKEKYTVLPGADSITIIENNFPAVLDHGIAISADKGLVDDSLRFYIRSSKPSVKLYVMIHNYKTHAYFDRILLPGNEKYFTLPARLLPEGLATITVFDEKGSPLAERSIFREPAIQPNIKFELDSTVYHTRSKVRATIKATDVAGNPVQAVLSLACVLNSRIDTTRFQDIAPFMYFNNYKAAGIITQKPDYNQYQRSRMERFLLIQCWTRYRWLSADSTIAAPQSPVYSLKQQGYVFYFGEKLKRPVDLILVTPNSLETIRTDETGYFEIDKNKLATEPDWNLLLAVNEKLQHNYSVILVNDNDKLQEKLVMPDYPLPRKINYVPEEQPADISNIKTLAAVTIKSKNGIDDDEAARIIRGFKKDPVFCRDYVCMYRILNCINHPGGKLPQKGFYYLIRENGGLKEHRYIGCLDDPTVEFKSNPYPDSVVYKLRGRYYTKEFYVADYSKYNPPLPETLSTLYWNPLVQTNEKGEAVIDFYTNDLKGRLILVAEGITANSVISGRRIFRVVQ